MISFIVRMRFEQEHQSEIREHLIALTLASRQEAGCVSYVPHFIEDDAGAVLIYEQYDDQGALDRHRATPHFARHAIGGLYQMMKDRAIENLTAVA